MALRGQESCFSTTSPLPPNFKLARAEARPGMGFLAKVGLSLMSLSIEASVGQEVQGPVGCQSTPGGNLNLDDSAEKYFFLLMS